MKIIETFICVIPIVNKLVKVHKCRNRIRNASIEYQYFMEVDNQIDEISEFYFNSIK